MGKIAKGKDADNNTRIKKSKTKSINIIEYMLISNGKRTNVGSN